MQEVIKKLEEHDKKFEQIDQRFEQVGKRFDQVDSQIDLVAQKVLEHDERLDRITSVVVEHTERLDRIERNMATKDDINNITNTLDKLVKLTERKDQELTVVAHDMKNFDNRITAVEQDVKIMKPLLGIS